MSQLTHSTSTRASVASRLWRALREGEYSTAFVSLLDQAFFSGCNFLTVIIVGRYCLQSELGHYQLILTAVLLGYFIQDSLITAPFRVYRHRLKTLRQDVYRGNLLLAEGLLLGVFSLAAAGMLLASQFGFGPPQLVEVFWLLPAILPFILLRDFCRRFSFADMRISRALMVDAFVAIAQIGLLFWLLKTDRLTVRNVYIVIGWCCSIASLTWLLLGVRKVRFSVSRFWEDLLRNWSFGRWMMASMLLCNMLPMVVLPWILAFTHSEAATGTLTACLGLIGAANVLINGIDNMIGPRAAKMYTEGGPAKLMAILGKAVLFYVVLVGAFAVCVGLFGQSAVDIIYKGKYPGVTPVLIVLSLNAFMLGLNSTASAGLYAMDRPNINFFADLCIFACVATAIGFLVVWFGVLGGAMAHLLGTTSGAIVRWLILWRLTASWKERIRSQTPSSLESGINNEVEMETAQLS